MARMRGRNKVCLGGRSEVWVEEGVRSGWEEGISSVCEDGARSEWQEGVRSG